MIKFEIALNKGELEMDIYNDIDGIKFYEFTKEDWEEVSKLLYAVNKYFKKDGDVDNG